MQVMLLHGLGQDSSSFQKTVSFLEDFILPVCPDILMLPGGGEASYENLYEAFCAYCDRHQEPLNLCGLSLGGILALHYTADHPERVRSLVLIGVQYKMPRMLLKLQNLIFRFMPEAPFEKLGLSKSGFRNLTASMMDLDFGEALKGISCPALIVCGDKDGANKRAAKDMAARIARAEIGFMRNAGHEVNLDSPRELAQLLNRFYKEKILLHSVHSDKVSP